MFTPSITIETHSTRMTVSEGEAGIQVKYVPENGDRGAQLWVMPYKDLYEALIQLGLPLVHLSQKGNS